MRNTDGKHQTETNEPSKSFIWLLISITPSGTTNLEAAKQGISLPLFHGVLESPERCLDRDPCFLKWQLFPRARDWWAARGTSHRRKTIKNGIPERVQVVLSHMEVGAVDARPPRHWPSAHMQNKHRGGSWQGSKGIVFPVWKGDIPRHWPLQFARKECCCLHLGQDPISVGKLLNNDGASICSQELLWAYLKFFPNKPYFQQYWCQVGALVWASQSPPGSPMTNYCTMSPLSTPFLLPALLSASGHALLQSVFVMSNSVRPWSPGFFYLHCVYKAPANN